jgi:hypothetical protein
MVQAICCSFPWPLAAFAGDPEPITGGKPRRGWVNLTTGDVTGKRRGDVLRGLLLMSRAPAS